MNKSRIKAYKTSCKVCHICNKRTNARLGYHPNYGNKLIRTCEECEKDIDKLRAYAEIRRKYWTDMIESGKIKVIE